MKESAINNFVRTGINGDCPRQNGGVVIFSWTDGVCVLCPLTLRQRQGSSELGVLSHIVGFSVLIFCREQVQSTPTDEIGAHYSVGLSPEERQSVLLLLKWKQMIRNTRAWVGCKDLLFRGPSERHCSQGWLRKGCLEDGRRKLWEAYQALKEFEKEKYFLI